MVNLFESSEVCTHQLPNKVQLIDKSFSWSFAAEDIWQVKLSPDTTARANFCPNGDLSKCQNLGVKGFWQDYYDQAFHVELENGLRFVANFRYELKDKYTMGKQLSNLTLNYLNEVIPNTEEETKVKFFSRCD